MVVLAAYTCEFPGDFDCSEICGVGELGRFVLNISVCIGSHGSGYLEMAVQLYVQAHD